MSKCMYCKKEIETLHPVIVGKDKAQFMCCCDDCANKSVEFYNFLERYKPHFITVLVTAMTVFFAGVIVLDLINRILGGILFFSAIGLMGLDFLVFPFATPETFSIFGIKRTILVTRIIGAFLIGLGILLGYASRIF